MTVETRTNAVNWNHSGFDTPPIRVAVTDSSWLRAGPDWQIVSQRIENIGRNDSSRADCLLLESGELAALSVDDLAMLALPVVLALPANDVSIDGDAADRADAFVFADDDAATMAAVFAGAAAGESGFQVRDLSDGTARTINALSAEASRIANALTRLAEAQRTVVATEQSIDSALVRRLLRVRRERDRFFPAELFADPAWDMLLDLTAARLEGKTVPVSSLCIAAAVPTTTALRWVRSLTQAGLLERRVDPTDGRRTYVSLSSNAAAAMFAYLRMFGAQFGMR